MRIFRRPVTPFLLPLVLTALAVGCGGGGGNPGSVPAASPTPTPTPTPAPTAGPSRFQPGVTGTRGDLPLLWQTTTGQDVYLVVTPDAGLPNAPATARRITAPDTYGDRAFAKWEMEGADFSTVSAVEPPETGRQSVSLRAVYRPRTSGAEGFQPSYSRPSFRFWKAFPLRVHFDRATLTAANDAAIRSGMDKWARATGGVIGYVVTEKADEADVEITAGSMPEQQLGFTQVWWDDSGEISRAVITLSNTTVSGGERQNLLTPVTAHEYGHALGILGKDDTGHSDDPRDIMYKSINPQIAVISERDMNVLTNLYPALLSSGGRAAHPARVGAGTAIAE